MKKNRSDLIGKKFGRLTVVRFHRVNEKYETFWECKCICGKLIITRRCSLVQGNSKSCGCLNNELVKKRALEKSLKGRVKEERLYSIWCGMKQRCYGENSTEFNRYGKRGIRICDEWINDYKSFRKWSIANKYSDKFSIERIDNDGDYKPKNCKWATPKQQANNRSNSLFLEYKDKKQTLAQWSEELNIPYACLYRRLRGGWSVEKTFNSPSKSKRSG